MSLGLVINSICKRFNWSDDCWFDSIGEKSIGQVKKSTFDFFVNIVFLKSKLVYV